jgi:hypothetical protein
MGTITGEITNIYYSSSSLMTPTSVEIDGTEYEVGNDDVAYAFSVYSTREKGDKVTVVWRRDSDGKQEITAVAK